MLQFKNLTRFAGTIAVFPDPDGVDSIYTIIKGTFVLRTEPVPDEVQVPITKEDKYNGEPGQSSLRMVSDLGLSKSATDVLLHGHAYVNPRSTATAMDVQLNIGPVRKTARVFGDRVWDSGLFGARISPPQPFQKIPLVWERAYGGFDETAGEPPRVESELRNPVGTGFRLRKGKKELAGMKLPNLEDPNHLIGSWKDRPPPANFGPIGAAWEPRKSWAGTYDDAWQKQRAPYLPKDFDPRFFHVSPLDQVVPGYLKGGESFEVVGASVSGPIKGALPRYRVEAAYTLDGPAQLRPASLDTVVIEPDAARLTMIWRAVFPCDKQTLRVREITARAFPF